MFEVLVESGRRQSRVAGSRALALTAHCAALLLAGVGVRQAAPEPEPPPRIFPVDIYTDTPAGPARVPSPLGGVPGIARGPAITDIPVSIPTVIPVDGPGPSIGDSVPSARELARQGIWGRHPLGSDGEGDGVGVRLAGEVDDPVTVLTPSLPVYPPALAAAGIAGVVRLEFVVDTTGRCEPGSIRVIRSTRAGFEAPAAEAVRKTVYRPARSHGRLVRQLVDQSLVFRMQ